MVVEPAVLLDFFLLLVRRRVRGPLEGRGRPLSLVARGAAELLDRMRTVRADIQIRFRMRLVRLTESDWPECNPVDRCPSGRSGIGRNASPS